MTGGLKQVNIILMLLAAVLLAWPSIALAQGSFTPSADDTTITDINPFGAEEPAVSDLNLNEDLPRAVHYESPKVYKGERISLDFQNADLHNIIRIIGEVSGKNIVVSDAVNGKVTLKLTDVPWDQALDIVLSARNLGVEESGNVLTIYDLPTLTNLQAARQRATAERAEAARLAPLAKKVFTPKYAPIGLVKTEMEKVISGRGKIVNIGNDIYVEDDPGTLSTMTQIFLRVDKVARQILIEARIIEASATFKQTLGIDWSVKYNQSGLSGVPGEGSGSIDINDTSGLTLGVGFLNKAQSLMLSATIKASETSSDARTISAPRIMAANDQEVYIKQGKQIPYYSGSSANTAANVEYKDVVMELRVKPHIEENGQIVTLDIKLTNDSPDYSSGGSGGEPAINTREAETRLMVKDGETVVIGGIIIDNQSTGFTRVPGLHRIPLLGWLFQSESISNDKSEMLIFITANIIPINI
ncbi:hypothetical protein C4J81_08230 [Deltaproteobacteria bacterium Smac51]|nr:hypothetical protein C4J81_08230 [Deltaproteobacteria bacterium Smac51]